jgi:hypothetical protein
LGQATSPKFTDSHYIGGFDVEARPYVGRVFWSHEHLVSPPPAAPAAFYRAHFDIRLLWHTSLRRIWVRERACSQGSHSRSRLVGTGRWSTSVYPRAKPWSSAYLHPRSLHTGGVGCYFSCRKRQGGRRRRGCSDDRCPPRRHHILRRCAGLVASKRPVDARGVTRDRCKRWSTHLHRAAGAER